MLTFFFLSFLLFLKLVLASDRVFIKTRLVSFWSVHMYICIYVFVYICINRDVSLRVNTSIYLDLYVYRKSILAANENLECFLECFLNFFRKTWFCDMVQ